MRCRQASVVPGSSRSISSAMRRELFLRHAGVGLILEQVTS